ncbi:hypothetical protein Btru_001640 [Bulinus truncatus]|nr:hypothetical protein Btru_001640 [Bulinus truncatus]
MNPKLAIAVLVLVCSLVDARGRGRDGDRGSSSSGESNSRESADVGEPNDWEEYRWSYNVSGRLDRARAYIHSANNTDVTFIIIWNQPQPREGISYSKIFISNNTAAVRIGRNCYIFNSTESIEEAVEKVQSLNGTVEAPDSTLYLNATRQLTRAERDAHPQLRGICSNGRGNTYIAEQVSAPGQNTKTTFYLDQKLVITEFPPPPPPKHHGKGWKH